MLWVHMCFVMCIWLAMSILLAMRGPTGRISFDWCVVIGTA